MGRHLVSAAMLAATATALALASPSAAQTPRCDALEGAHAELAGRLLARIHPYACCDDTLAECLAREAACTLVSRLADDVCRQVAAGASASEIERSISRRAQTMMPAITPARIALDDATRAGKAAAPVTLVMYACTTCTFCYAIASDLHDEITSGRLAGRVKLYYRSFPLRDHENAVEGGLAVTAAGRLGVFWPFTRLVYENMAAFSTEAAAGWAESVGLDRAAFEAAMGDPATREAVAASRREGLANRVSATPTFFVNGRRYVYEISLEALVDVLLEEYEAVSGERIEVKRRDR